MRPSLNDQTAYQVPCSSPEQALLLCALLNSAPIRQKSPHSCSDEASKRRPISRKSGRSKEPTPDSIIPPASTGQPDKPNHDRIMRDLLARKQATAFNTSDKLPPADARSSRRKQLGRATSTTSGRSTPEISRQSSENIKNPDSISDDAAQKERHQDHPEPMADHTNMASQCLLYEDPHVQAQREEMIKRMGGVVEEGGGFVDQIGVVKDVDDGAPSVGRGGRRRRL